MLKPLSDRVLVEFKPKENVTAAGIFLGDVEKESIKEGVILAVGCGKKNDKGECLPMSLQVGDRIIYGKYSGIEVDAGMFLMREDEILAIIE